MKHLQDLAVTGVDETRSKALIATYSEICKSYHAIDEFRAKLLGFLPLTSLLGIVLLGKDDVLANPAHPASQLVAFVSVFAATFTLALFLYEIRGILRCNALIHSGRNIETELGIHGQFCVCIEADEARKASRPHDRITSFFNAIVAACIVYSVVFAAWAFLVLRYGYGAAIRGCAFTAVAIGLLLAGCAYAMVNKLVAA